MEAREAGIKAGLGTGRRVCLAMFALQEAWLLATWLAGASANPGKLIGAGLFSLVGFLVVFCLPAAGVERLERGYRWLEERPVVYMAALGLALLAVSVVYVNQQRIWTDEQDNFNFTKQWVSNGAGYYWANYAKYGWVRQHPPLMFVLNGLSMAVLGARLAVIRWATAAFSLGLVGATAGLGRALYNRSSGLLAALYLLTFPLFIRVGTAGMLDVQAAFFFTLAVWLSVRLMRRPSYLLASGLGLTLGLGLLTKYMMAFVVPVIGMLALLALVRGDGWPAGEGDKRVKVFKRAALPFVLAGGIGLAMFLGWGWYAARIGVRTPLTGTIQVFNGGEVDDSAAQTGEGEADEDYLSVSLGYFIFSVEGLKFTINSLATRLAPGIGVYLIPLILMGLIALARRRGGADVFVLAWIGIIAAILLLTIPDHRYFILVFPALALVIAAWLQDRRAALVRTTLLALIFQAGALYVFLDWERIKLLF